MAGKDDLFQLIHSLSKTEKRYFKVRHAKSVDQKSNYLRLFDVINKMEVYEEEVLSKHFRGEKLLNNLPKEKAYLYQAILKSMRAYRKDKSSDVRIRELLANASFLRERSLYSQSGHMLQKAKSIAREYENFIALIEILYQERELLKNIKPRKGDTQMSTLLRESEEVLKALTKQGKYLELYDNLFFKTLQSNQARNKESADKLKEIINNPLILNLDAATTFRDRHRLLSILAMNATLNSEASAAHEYYGEIVVLWKGNKKIRSENIYKYRNVLSNYLNACFGSDKLNDVPSTIEELKTIPPKNFHDEGTIFKTAYLAELNYCISMLELDKGQNLIPEIEAGLALHNEAIGASRIQTFNGNIAILFFLKEDFNAALDWVNRIINTTKSKTRQDIQRFARLFQLILHFEIGNLEYIENLLRSVSRYMKSLPENLKFEDLVLQTFRKLLQTPVAQHPEIFNSFKKEFQYLETEETERRAIGFTVCKVWAHSKTSGENLAESFAEMRNKELV